MRHWRRHSRLRAVLAAALVLCQAACRGYQVAEPTPAALPSAESPRNVRVLRADSSKVFLSRAFLRGDSIVGLVDRDVPPRSSYRTSPPVPDPGRDTVAIPLTDVRSIAVSRADAGTTLLVLVSIVAVIGIVGSMADLGPDLGGGFGGSY